MRIRTAHAALAAGLAYLLSPFSVACAQEGYRCKGPSDASLRESLKEAAESRDPQAAALARLVLEDALAGTYCYGVMTRTAAIHYLRYRSASENLPLVRKVAVLNIVQGQDYKTTLDEFVAGGAITVLSAHKDPFAKGLALKGLEGPRIVRASALEALAELKQWDVTARVEQVLETTSLDADGVLVLGRALEFLVRSPEVSQPFCAKAKPILKAFAECATVEMRTSDDCWTLMTPLAGLDRRLACGLAVEIPDREEAGRRYEECLGEGDSGVSCEHWLWLAEAAPRREGVETAEE
jgi:hypothetical protein